MFLRGSLVVVSVLVSVPVHALQVLVADVAENGAVIPVEIRPDRPVSAGQQLDLLVNGELAAQVRVVKGALTTFSTRVKGSRNTITIAARVLAGGSETERGSHGVKVSVPASVGGPTTVAGSIKQRKNRGDIKLLMQSANGFAGTLVLQDAGFHVEIGGSNSLAKDPFIGLKGEFSDQVTASIDSSATLAAAPARPAAVAPAPGGTAGTAGSMPVRAAPQPAPTGRSAMNTGEVMKLLGGLVGAAAAGGNSAERKQLMIGVLSQAANDSGSMPDAVSVGGVGKVPDPRCAFVKPYFGYYPWGDVVMSSSALQLHDLVLHRESIDKQKKLLEIARERVTNFVSGDHKGRRALKKLADRKLKEWQESLDCARENRELTLAEGESLPQLRAYPNAWGNLSDIQLYEHRGRERPWKACETFARHGWGLEGALSFGREPEAGSIYSRFMLASQLAYMRDLYKELTTESELSMILRDLGDDPRTRASGDDPRQYVRGRTVLDYYQEIISDLECEAQMGFPFSAETTFVANTTGENRRRYPGTQLPRCTKARPCSVFTR